MRPLAASIAAGLILLLALAVPAVAVNFHAPVEIIDDGAIYTLDQNVGNSPATAFVVVKADNVEIDGQGFTLDGRDYGTSKAIVVERFIRNNVWEYPENTVIHNIELSDWGTAVYDYLGDVTVYSALFISNTQGILFKTVHDGRVFDCSFVNNWQGIKTLNDRSLEIHDCWFEGNYWGVYTVFSDDLDIYSCNFLSNTFGIRTQRTTDFNLYDLYFNDNYWGLYLMSSSDGNIQESTVVVNTVGIHVGDASTDLIFVNLYIAENAASGIFLANGVAGNLFFNNILYNWHNVRFESTAVGPNAWSLDNPLFGTNIIGGSHLGGNYWAQPDMMGWSETAPDVADVLGNIGPDGFTDMPYELAVPGNVDDFPLHL